MGKFGDILLVSDFDRTLTNKEDEISQANLDAIADFMREGRLPWPPVSRWKPTGNGTTGCP